jgi:hypothetical protein
MLELAVVGEEAIEAYLDLEEECECSQPVATR